MLRNNSAGCRDREIEADKCLKSVVTRPAASKNHKPGMLRVKEEFLATMSHGNDRDIRADMVFFETASAA